MATPIGIKSFTIFFSFINVLYSPCVFLCFKLFHPSYVSCCLYTSNSLLQVALYVSSFFLSLLALSTFSFAYYYFGSCVKKQWNKNLFYLCHVDVISIIVLLLLLSLYYSYFHHCATIFVVLLMLLTCCMLLPTCCMLLPTCYYWFQCVVATSIILLVFLTYCYYFHCVIGTFVMLLLLPFICTCLCPCFFFVLLFLSCC
jgi:hypothetical protein